jgi:hypothetical protein
MDRFSTLKELVVAEITKALDKSIATNEDKATNILPLVSIVLQSGDGSTKLRSAIIVLSSLHDTDFENQKSDAWRLLKFLINPSPSHGSSVVNIEPISGVASATYNQSKTKAVTTEEVNRICTLCSF